MNMTRSKASRCSYILIYSATCPFCTWMARRIYRFLEGKNICILPNTLEWLPALDKRLTPAFVKRDVHVLSRCCKRVYSGGAVIPCILDIKYGKKRFVKIYDSFWLIRSIIDLGYRITKKARYYIPI